MSQPSSKAGSRPPSKPASPKLAAAAAPSSKRGSGSAATQQAEAKYDPEGAAGTAAGAVAAGRRSSGSSALVSRPSSAVKSSRPTSAAANGPVKAVYRPAAAAAAAAAGSASAASPAVAAAKPPAAAIAAVTAPLSSLPPIPRRPRRLPNLPPDDSDYDSEELLSDEETEEERPLVHNPAVPLGFALARPDPRQIKDQDQLPAVDPEADEPLALGMQHILTAPELLPRTSVALEHQSTLLESNGAAIAAETVKKAHAAGQPSFNIASFSSGPAASASNDLLYTDAHAPFVYSAHGRPMTLWIIGKPFSGKASLARKVQQELGLAAMAPVVSQSAAAKASGRDYPPARLTVRDYSATIALITPEFLVSHAKESSATAGAPKFPEIDTVLAHLAEGTPVPAALMRNLFIFALHSERVATHGFILANIDFLLAGDKGVAELAGLGKMYPKLVETGVWPPQHVVELSISDEEILARLARRKSQYIARRIGDVAGFKEPSLLERSEKDETAEDGSESVPPSAPAGLTGGMGSMSGLGGAISRPTSAMSRRGGDDDRASDPALEYSLYSNLHRSNDVADWTDEQYDELSATALLSLAEGQASGGSQGSAAGGLGSGPLNARYLRLDSEADVQESLLRFQTTRAQLLHLIKGWSQFQPEVQGSSQQASLASTQRLHTLSAALPLSDLLSLVLALLGQTKWGSGLALATHLPFVAKEELRPIEEDEVRELLLLPNLNNSTKDLPGVLPPQTNDPSGLDLDSEAAFEHVQHVFGVWQTFCPVSLLSEGKMVEGSEEFAASFQGHVYLLASAAHLRRFQAAPLKFVATPPALPASFVLSIVGGSSTGKSSLARRFADQFGWTVHELDGTEEAIMRAAARINAGGGGGHHVLDGGPATLPHFELAQAQGLKIDKVAYVFVDDVEVLPGRVRLQRKMEDALKPPLTEEQKAAEAEAAAAAAALAEKAMSPAQKKKKVALAKSKAEALAAAGGANAAGAEDETTQEEEDLMDRVDEWQNDVWPNVLLPWLEEHAYACTEINNSTIVQPPAPMVVSITPPSAASSAAAATPAVDAAAPAAPLTLPPAVVAAIDSTFESLRRCVDPFFNYRWVSRARRLTPEMVERSWKEEDRIPRGLPPAVTAAAATAQANVAAGAAAGNGGGGTISSAVSQAGLTSSDNPRGLRFNDVNFCPVCLLDDQRLLVPGRHAEGVSLGASSYSCCSEQCALRFVAEPQRFNLNSPARLAELAPSMPALRILVTGGRASGKSHASKALQQHFGLSYSFSLGALLFPALKSLAQSTLKLVMEAEAAETEKRAAAKEARRAEKQARKDAAAAARVALAAAAGAAGEDAEDADDLESESDSGDDSFDEAEEVASHAEMDAAKKDADILRLYISTQAAKIHEHSAILQELMEEEWFTPQQIEQLLRDIFASHAWIDSAGPKHASNAAGWVCEVDLHSAPLLARLDAVLRDADPASNFAKPHVILPLECAQRIAVQRLVATEEERRSAQRGEAEAGEAGAAGGSDESSAQSAMLKNLSEKHRLKQEALEKAARELREKEEAAALAKANKPKRFGKDAAGKDKKSARGAGAEEKEDGGADKKKKKLSKKEAAAEAAAAEAALAEKSQADAQAAEAAAAAEAEAGAKSSADAPAADAAAAAAAAAASAAAAGGEKSEADLALEAELEEKRAAAARALEELTAVMSELLKASLETDHAFVSALKARPGIFGFVVLEPVSSTAVARWGPESFVRRLAAAFETFLQAQAALFQPTIEISMSDSNKLLRNGMRTLRAFGSFCPCCLLADEPVAYDCKVSLSNTGGRDYYPVMWSHNIVLTCSREHKREFCANARKFLMAPPPPPIVAPRIVVLESADAAAGEAESMSAALARKLSVELNLVYLTLPSILSRLCAPSCALALGSHVREALSEGEALSDALLVQCVAHAVQSFSARARGWVLEGFPRTLAQARLLKQSGVVPQEVLTIHDSRAPELQALSQKQQQSKALAQRSDLIARMVSALEEMPPAADPVASSDDLPLLPFRRRRGVSTLLPPSLASLNLEAACVVALPEPQSDSNANVDAAQQRAEVERFFTANYHNVSALYTGPAPGSAGTQTPNSHLSSPWQQGEYALALVKAHRRLRQEYLEATHGAPTFSASRPGRIAHLGFTRLQLLTHASAFGDYCPVSWIRDGLLNRSEGVRDNALTVEYRQQFYRLASAEYRAIFEASPDSFVGGGEAALTLPRELPFALAPEDAVRVQATNCELNGFCPVTIRQSALQGAATSVLPGLAEHTVCYRNRLYRMRGPREMQAFLSLPSVYSSVRLPQKMPAASSAFTIDSVGVGGSGARAAGALSGQTQSASDLLVLGKTLAFMEVEFSALLMKGLNSFEGLFPEARAQRIKYPALPLSSSALLYLTLFLKTNNPRNEPHIKEKYANKLREFVAHCALIPTVASQYKSDNQDSGTGKVSEESKEAESSPSASAPLALSDAALQYDTLRSELRAHADKVGSRQSLAQFFERYLR